MATIDITTADAATLQGIRSSLQVPSLSAIPNLPVPKITLTPIESKVTYLSSSHDSLYTPVGVDPTVQYGIGGDLTFQTVPYLTVDGFTKEFLKTNQVFVEMVIFKKPRKHKAKSYVAPVATSSKPWGNHRTRSGSSSLLTKYNIVRVNHVPVNGLGEVINLTDCLNNHFIEKTVQYFDAQDSGNTKPLNVIVPTGTKVQLPGGNVANGYGYSPGYKGLYFAFRYIVWQPLSNNGKGEIISGPLSPVIRAANLYFPFINNFSQTLSLLRKVVDLNDDFDKTLFKCSFAK